MQIYINDLFMEEIRNLNELIKSNNRIFVHKLIDKVKNDEEIDVNDIEAYKWLHEKYELQKEKLINYLENNGDYYNID